MKSPIFAIGNRGVHQCSMREDGVWFERFRREMGPGWTAWKRTLGSVRPAFAWYNPAAGRAVLPKDDQ